MRAAVQTAPHVSLILQLMLMLAVPQLLTMLLLVAPVQVVPLTLPLTLLLHLQQQLTLFLHLQQQLCALRRLLNPALLLQLHRHLLPGREPRHARGRVSLAIRGYTSSPHHHCCPS